MTHTDIMSNHIPALPGLNVGKTDVELFKDCVVIFLFCFFFGVLLERGNRLVHG